MLRRLRKGQSTAEYAIVIGLVIAAAIAMQTYIKRSIQGKMKDATSTTADVNIPGINAPTIGSTPQFEPAYATTDNMVQTRDAVENTSTVVGGGLTRSITGNDLSTRSGVTRIAAETAN